MRCPFCQADDSKVLDSRQTENKMAIRRRRECAVCRRRFTTYEKFEEIPFMVVKKDGRREPFSHTKLLAGLAKACEKRPIPSIVLEESALTIERMLRDIYEWEIPSQAIGEAVMERLFQIDEIAYIRFASVYRQFTDIQKFMEELDDLLRRKNQPEN
ncbi:MAG: transcriptional regulator NrdR [Peptococcaceae bacterium]|jgi:transcriptional repressor NrdR|nr:transcriptional regulator NrdR [Peptococcaceae bacterium]